MSAELDLLYTDVEDDLRATVRDALTDRCDSAAVTAMYDGDRALVPGLWKTLAVDLGLAGLLVPEEAGGAGASAREAAVVLEELGRAVAPVPFLTSAVVATTALAGHGRRAARRAGGGGAGRRARGAALDRAGRAAARPAGRRRRPDHRHGHQRRRGAGGGRPAGSGGRRAARRPDRRCAGDARGVAGHDPPARGRDVRGRAGRAGRRRRGAGDPARAAGRCGAARVRAARPGPLVPGGDRRLPEGAPAVRPGGGRFPGAQAPPRRPLDGGRVRQRRGPARRGRAGDR